MERKHKLELQSRLWKVVENYEKTHKVSMIINITIDKVHYAQIQSYKTPTNKKRIVRRATSKKQNTYSRRHAQSIVLQHKSGNKMSTKKTQKVRIKNNK